MNSSQTNKPFGLYIHIPFCQSKCPYCDFNTYQQAESHIPKTMNAIKTSLEKWSSILKYKNISTIFFGGGTPSYINSEYIEELLNLAKTKFNLLPNAEITLETNPNDVTISKLNDYLEFGINRLSLGIQTMDNDLLKTLGRRHNAEEAKNAVILAYQAGFTNISVDLMYGLPKQSTNSLSKTLTEILALNPTHISAYALTFEKGTEFFSLKQQGILKSASDNMYEKMHEIINQTITSSNYERYEISNWAKPNHESKHNLNYWKRGNYLGIGPGAHSLIESYRFWNVRSLKHFFQKESQWKPLNKSYKLLNNTFLKTINTIDSFEFLSKELQLKETIILGLRLTEGLNISEVENIFNINFNTLFEKQIRYLKQHGLISISNNKLKLTDRGIFLSNQVFVEFI